MGKTKARGKYRTVSLPDSVYSDIQSYIKKNDNYRSMADYIIEAVRVKQKKQNKKFNTDFDTFLHHYDELRGLSVKMERTDPAFVKISKLINDILQELKQKHTILEYECTQEEQEFLKKRGQTFQQFMHEQLKKDMKKKTKN